MLQMIIYIRIYWSIYHHLLAGGYR